MKERILGGARTLFLQYGVRSVSMDDVARDLSVSKKTLYQYFKNKDDLVTEAVRLHLTEEKHGFKCVAESSSDAIDAIFNISLCLREHSLKVNPSLLHDLQKYHSGAWEIFEEFKKSVIKRLVQNILIRGIEEGHFREGINPSILSVLRMEIIQLLFNNQVFPRAEYDLMEVQAQIYDHFVNGILSEKGRELYQQYQLKEKSLK